MLGPILFFIYISHLRYVAKTNFDLFADDTTIIDKNDKKQMQAVSLWFQTNMLKLNENKKQRIYFLLRELNKHTTSIYLRSVPLDSKMT